MEPGGPEADAEADGMVTEGFDLKKLSMEAAAAASAERGRLEAGGAGFAAGLAAAAAAEPGCW